MCKSSLVDGDQSEFSEEAYENEHFVIFFQKLFVYFSVDHRTMTNSSINQVINNHRLTAFENAEA